MGYEYTFVQKYTLSKHEYARLFGNMEYEVLNLREGAIKKKMSFLGVGKEKVGIL